MMENMNSSNNNQGKEKLKPLSRQKAKRFVRYTEGAEMYSMSLSKFQELAKDAKACYKIKHLVLVSWRV